MDSPDGFGPTVVAAVAAFDSPADGDRHHGLIDVSGVPLLARLIGAAKAADTVDSVVVLTDDAHVADRARESGTTAYLTTAAAAAQPQLPEPRLSRMLAAELSSEFAPQLVVLLPCRLPGCSSADIDRAVAAMRRSGAEALYAVSVFDRPRRFGEGAATVSSLESGLLYVFTGNHLRATGGVMGPAAIPYQTSDAAGSLSVIPPGAPDAPRLGDFDLLVFDFDGVFTDNTVYLDEHGTESVRCSRGDGYGVELLRKAGLDMAILSTEVNTVVAHRAAKLKLPVLHGSTDKGADIARMVADRPGLTFDRVAYIGNDLNDLPAMERVGLPIATANAVPEVKRLAHWVTSVAGGDGAIRELADVLLA